MKNYYQVLGLEEGSTLEEIKAAYRQYVLHFHPDKHGGDPFFKEKFLEVQEAYEYLINNYENENSSHKERELCSEDIEIECSKYIVHRGDTITINWNVAVECSCSLILDNGYNKVQYDSLESNGSKSVIIKRSNGDLIITLFCENDISEAKKTVKVQVVEDIKEDMTENVAENIDAVEDKPSIHGWLLFFLILMNATAAINIIIGLSDLNQHGEDLSGLVIGLVQLALSVYTTCSFYKRKSDAVFLAKTMVVTISVLELFCLCFYENANAGEMFIYSADFICNVLWFNYFCFSKQVEELIPKERRTKNRFVTFAIILFTSIFILLIGIEILAEEEPDESPSSIQDTTYIDKENEQEYTEMTPKNDGGKKRSQYSTYGDNGEQTNEINTSAYVYALDYVCENETTSGMAKWAVAMKKKEDVKVKALTKKLKRGRKAELSVALDNEAACWENVSGSINTLNARILELQYWFGGSMGTVAKAFAPLNVSFIRRACLNDDIGCLKKESTKTTNDYMDVGTKTLFASISTVIESVDINNVDSELFTEYYGSKADYIKTLNYCKEDTMQVEADIQEWLNARKNVEGLLSPTERALYRFHTFKVINSLANCVKNCVEG